MFVPPKVLRTLPHVLEINRQEMQRRIDQRTNTKHLDYFESLVPSDAPIPVGRERSHLEQISVQLLIAGYEPIADQFYGLIFQLLKEPEILAALVDEIRGNFQSYTDINPDALISFRYLNACIHESFRVLDTGSNGLPRVSPGAMVDGSYVPKGVSYTMIVVSYDYHHRNFYTMSIRVTLSLLTQVECQTSFFTILRNEKYFCDPFSYRPQRWLPPDHPKYEEKYSGDALKALLPFSTGPRQCPGRESAWIIIRMFLAKLLWTYDLELVRGHELTFDKDFTVHTMWNKPSIWVRFLPVVRE